jgi:hypothetical protein
MITTPLQLANFTLATLIHLTSKFISTISPGLEIFCPRHSDIQKASKLEYHVSYKLPHIKDQDNHV